MEISCLWARKFRWHQVKILIFCSLSIFAVPSVLSNSPGRSLWEGEVCVEVQISLWTVDFGDWSPVLWQDRKELNIGLWAIFRTPKEIDMPCPAQGCIHEGLQQRRYLQLPISAHLALFSLLLTPRNTRFPCGALVWTETNFFLLILSSQVIMIEIKWILILLLLLHSVFCLSEV